MRRVTIAIWVLTIVAYLARPWSCLAALLLEERPPENPYHSVDPHGFGVLGAIVIALAMMGPVLWLLLQRRPADVVSVAPVGRIAAVMAALATPMLLQITYLRLPLQWCWPVVAASIVWALVVLASCLRTAPGSWSALAAFDRHPRIAWTLVATIGLSKAGIIVAAIA
ncbi:hypothetical protein QLH51_17890 [Sphingomonas sp. 2R-10]|uniref:hypothetical protein n=1 Tax=Sphingomonas sp. 2R-10 TaxID=3045148 RepID=UPI000F77F2BF|nr:hypothetical protein [Sphingomonas sp. 2R-10]MDJ0278668.1 hypothetical protein [Sphingomonas sp. 2R-10]